VCNFGNSFENFENGHTAVSGHALNSQNLFDLWARPRKAGEPLCHTGLNDGACFQFRGGTAVIMRAEIKSIVGGDHVEV
jgi:hypothetical protein